MPIPASVVADPPDPAVFPVVVDDPPCPPAPPCAAGVSALKPPQPVQIAKTTTDAAIFKTEPNEFFFIGHRYEQASSHV
jgi:hypothetical protein